MYRIRFLSNNNEFQTMTFSFAKARKQLLKLRKTSNYVRISNEDGNILAVYRKGYGIFIFG